MTHPPAGPSTPTPPSGPRYDVTPLTPEQRIDNYRRQTGRELTPRQRRRVAKKANRAAVRETR